MHQCQQGQYGFLVVTDILTCFFAEHGGIAIAVEQVVLQLEGQSEVFAEFAYVEELFLRSTGIECTYFEGSRQQHRGLQANHLHVGVEVNFIKGHILEVHVHLLSFAYQDGGFVEALQYLL